MKTLTVFTPTYNRAHTLERTYRSLCSQTCKDFEWMVIDDGSTDDTRTLIARLANEDRLTIHYIHKENGGLHTGYNTAYANIRTPLCVCVDSDDYMPPRAVELILDTWRKRGSDRYAGIIGLDHYAETDRPIGGGFPDGLKECYLLDLYTHDIHYGDTKQVMRTELMRRVAPQTGFEGERFFNPIYMLLQVCDEYPLLVLNENLCMVDYGVGDNMSRAIFRQYTDSPRSFAKLRLQAMSLKRSTFAYRLRAAIHYVAECLIARDGDWLRNSPRKLTTLCMAPLGMALWAYIRYRVWRMERGKKTIIENNK
ncbi:glycosyltransferase family 2 protein [Bacteroides sp. AN502(2024)]|uniref:glycosyltransferase family 2 protein n=1 Tax=Bacteroides sp. AN502(2024) TaxID=3160599 RepID=UPI003519BA21